jgi:hypothetical protein
LAHSNIRLSSKSSGGSMRDRNIGSPHIACGYLFGFDIAFAHGHEKTPFRKSVVRDNRHIPRSAL